jgi:hypothetical protein
MHSHNCHIKPDTAAASLPGNACARALSMAAPMVAMLNMRQTYHNPIWKNSRDDGKMGATTVQSTRLNAPATFLEAPFQLISRSTTCFSGIRRTAKRHWMSSIAAATVASSM